MDTCDASAFYIDEWLVEPTLNRISRGAQIEKVDPRHMQVLELLASVPGRVFSQREIEAAVWKNVIVTTGSVYQSITQLRRSLNDSANNPRYIATVPRKGYRIIAEVRQFKVEHVDIQVPLAPQPLSSPKNSSRYIVFGTAVVVPFLVLGATLFYNAWGGGFASLVQTKKNATLPGISAQDDLPFAMAGSPEPLSVRTQLLNQMADVALMHGRPEESLEHYKQALTLEQRNSGEKHPRVGILLSRLSNAYTWKRDYLAAKSTARAALDIFSDAPDLHPDKINLTAMLGHALIECGEYEEADGLIRRALEHSRILRGDLDLKTLNIKYSLSTLRLAQGKFEQAEQLARENLDAVVQLRGDDFLEASFRTQLALVLSQRGKYDEALAEAEITLSKLSTIVRPDHPYIGSIQGVIGSTLIKTGDYSKAEQVLRSAMRVWKMNDGWTWRVASTASALGETLMAQGRISEAERYLTYASRELESGQLAWSERHSVSEHSRRMRQLQLAKAKTRVRTQVADIAP